MARDFSTLDQHQQQQEQDRTPSYFTPQDALEQVERSNISFGILTKQEIQQVMASTASPSSKVLNASNPAHAPRSSTKTLSNGMSLLGLQDGRGFLTGNFRSTGHPESQPSLSKKSSAPRASPLSQSATAVAGHSSSTTSPHTSQAIPSTSRQAQPPMSYAASAAPPSVARSSSPLLSPTSRDEAQARRSSPSTNRKVALPYAASPSSSSPVKPPNTALALKPANDALSTSPRRKNVSTPIYKGPVDDNAPTSPALAPGFSFSRKLKVPSSVSNQYPSSTSPSLPSSMKPAQTETTAPGGTPSQPPSASSQEAPSASVEPPSINGAAAPFAAPSSSDAPAPVQQQQSQLPKSALKSPPTSPPKPALKATSWAALLRDKSNPTDGSASGSAGVAAGSSSPQQVKRVSIALPPEESSSTSASSLTTNRSGPSSVNGTQGGHKHATTSASVPSRKSVSLGQALKGVEHDQVHPHIAPRGMVNTGNMCFENTVLQALVFCPPFYNLIRLLGQSLPHDLSGANRLLESSIWLVNEYKINPKPDQATPREWSDPFLPEQVYEALRLNKRFATLQQGQQEDAQEFLGFFLDSLHDELLAAIEKSDKSIQQKVDQQTQAAAAATGAGGDDDWEEVGQKGRTATTRKAEVKESPITRIFAGLLRSMLRAPGQKDSALSEPFLSLQLDIQPPNVESIEDALANLAAPETVQDYATAGGRRVDATKQLCLEHLPPVLILHLKRFSYNNVGGTVKNHKIVGFETELRISPSILAPSQKSSGPIEYKLNAVIYHHGRSATGGHYTVALRQQNDRWINVDDTMITQVTPAEVAVNRVEEVLRLSLPSSYDGIPERSPYLLFYTRVAGKPQ